MMVMETRRNDRACVCDPDPALYGELFRMHFDTIYNYCFRRTADSAQAEDLTSVVFMEAWRGRGRVDLTIDNALPWLYGVATNVLRNSRRSLRRYRAALERIPAPLPPLNFADEVQERLDNERMMRDALAILAKLKRSDQEVLMLCEWEDLTPAEAARALDLPQGTVRSRLSRARARLNELVSELATTVPAVEGER